MAGTLPKFLDDEVRHWCEAIKTSGPTADGGDNAITDAGLAALTTVQGLVDLVISSYAVPHGPNDARNRQATLEAIYKLGPTTTPFFGYGIIGDSDVAGSNTVKALIANIYTLAGTPTDQQAIDTNLSGNTRYMGNIGNTLPY